MSRKILVYKDDYTASGEIIRSLSKKFPGDKISRVTIDDIRSGALRLDQPHHLFVLPGIYGEDCRYHDDFNDAATHEYHGFIKRGGVSLNICAGASTITRICNYVTPWGTYRNRLSMHPIFNGYANGPLWSYARQPQPAHIETTIGDLANTSVAPVLFKTEDGIWEQSHICYGNGPGLLADNMFDPDMEILGLYNGFPASPIALLRMKFGAGSVYLCSMHPEVTAPENDVDPKYARVHALSQALRPHEQGRDKLFTMLTSRIKKDLQL